jgi:threonine/homoserine/homoserine lactone efflux protein
MADNEQPKQPARHSSLAAVLLAGGILLLVVSFFWPGQSVSRSAWSPEQAKAYQAASVKLHGLSQETVAAAGSNNDKANREKLARAESEYKAIRSQLDSAIDRPKYMTYALRIFGSLFAIAGLALIYRHSNG